MIGPPTRFVYLYMVIFPATGEWFAMLLPYMNKMCFALFMVELSKNFPTEKLMVVLDRAGAHQASVVDNPNIVLLHLPPASPDRIADAAQSCRAIFSGNA